MLSLKHEAWRPQPPAKRWARVKHGQAILRLRGPILGAEHSRGLSREGDPWHGAGDGAARLGEAADRSGGWPPSCWEPTEAPAQGIQDPSCPGGLANHRHSNNHQFSVKINRSISTIQAFRAHPIRILKMVSSKGFLLRERRGPWHHSISLQSG